MAFDGVDRHIKHAGNLSRFEVFLIAKHNDHSRFLRQRINDSTQHIGKHEVTFASICHGLRHIIEAHLRANLLTAGLIYAAMARHLTQPKREVGRTLDSREVLVEVQEHFLSQLLCQPPVSAENNRQG